MVTTAPLSRPAGGTSPGNRPIPDVMRPDDYRTEARDLVRPGAYWRPLNRIEQRCDFAALEVNEGILIQRERERIAVIMLAQMERIIAWTRSASFGPSSAPKFKMPLVPQVELCFVRIATRSYWDACQAYDKERRRADELAGLRARKYPRSGLTSPAVRRLVAESVQTGRSFVDGIRKQIQPILSGAFALDGRRVKPQALLDGEIRTAFSKWVDGAPPEQTVQIGSPNEVDLAAPPLDADTPEQYAQWERLIAPVAAWIRSNASGTTIGSKGRTRKPQLNKDIAKHVIETEITRQRAAATSDSARLDSGVSALMYSTVREDGRICANCKARDGRVADKNDDWWVFNTPPMHYRCRCSVHPVRNTDPVPLTPRSELDAIETKELGPGFGAYDPGTDQGVPSKPSVPRSKPPARPVPATVPPAPKPVPSRRVPAAGSKPRPPAKVRPPRVAAPVATPPGAKPAPAANVVAKGANPRPYKPAIANPANTKALDAVRKIKPHVDGDPIDLHRSNVLGHDPETEAGIIEALLDTHRRKPNGFVVAKTPAEVESDLRTLCNYSTNLRALGSRIKLGPATHQDQAGSILIDMHRMDPRLVVIATDDGRTVMPTIQTFEVEIGKSGMRNTYGSCTYDGQRVELDRSSTGTATAPHEFGHAVVARSRGPQSFQYAQFERVDAQDPLHRTRVNPNSKLGRVDALIAQMRAQGRLPSHEDSRLSRARSRSGRPSAGAEEYMVQCYARAVAMRQGRTIEAGGTKIWWEREDDEILDIFEQMIEEQYRARYGASSFKAFLP